MKCVAVIWTSGSKTFTYSMISVVGGEKHSLEDILFFHFKFQHPFGDVFVQTIVSYKILNVTL